MLVLVTLVSPRLVELTSTDASPILAPLVVDPITDCLPRPYPAKLILAAWRVLVEVGLMALLVENLPTKRLNPIDPTDGIGTAALANIPSPDAFSAICCLLDAQLVNMTVSTIGA
jgi:hypothetical protein